MGNEGNGSRPAGMRRVVTGHDERGKAVFVADGPPPHILRRPTTVEFVELWNTPATPAPIAGPLTEPTSAQLTVGPPALGTRFRINVLPPGHTRHWPARPDGRHPGLHRTRSIDYGIVLEGELWLILDDSETLLRQGDVVIQRGTIHAWENRTDRDVRMAFILIDGVYEPELQQLLPAHIDPSPSEKGAR